MVEAGSNQWLTRHSVRLKIPNIEMTMVKQNVKNKF